MQITYDVVFSHSHLEDKRKTFKFARIRREGSEKDSIFEVLTYLSKPRRSQRDPTELLVSD